MIFCRKGLRVSRRRSYKFPEGLLARQALPGDPTELNRIVMDVHCSWGSEGQGL